MATINFTPVVDGTTIDAADVNTPLTTIYNEFNGNIDNANIKSGAAISGSKLADASIDLGAKASTFDGWVPVSDSWAYASDTTITVPSDATTKYSVGDKIKLVQSATTKYFYITGVTSTVLTITGGSDYTLANSAISGIYYSKAATPLNFPQYFSWAPTLTNVTAGNGTHGSKFNMIGKTVNFKFAFTLGSTSSVNSNPQFTLPVTGVTVPASVMSIGWSTYYDVSAPANQIGLTELVNTTTGQLILLTYGGAIVNRSGISSAAPFTWATGDVMIGTGSYEAA